MSAAVYAKAIAAAATTFAGSITTAASGDGAVTGIEWSVIVATTVAAAALTYAVPNKDRAGEHQDESVQPPAAGLVAERDGQMGTQGRGGYLEGQ